MSVTSSGYIFEWYPYPPLVISFNAWDFVQLLKIILYAAIVTPVLSEPCQQWIKMGPFLFLIIRNDSIIWFCVMLLVCIFTLCNTKLVSVMSSLSLCSSLKFNTSFMPSNWRLLISLRFGCSDRYMPLSTRYMFSRLVPIIGLPHVSGLIRGSA